MGTMVKELYLALVKAGVDGDTAAAAASAVVSTSQVDELVTRAQLADVAAELKVAIADARTDMIRWSVGTLAAMTGLFSAIVRLLL